MLAFVLYALLIWFLYNLIFRFIIPVYRTTREVKKKFREMHQKMQEQVNKQPGFANQSSPQQPAASKPGGDYIDFEEIK